MINKNKNKKIKEILEVSRNKLRYEDILQE